MKKEEEDQEAKEEGVVVLLPHALAASWAKTEYLFEKHSAIQNINSISRESETTT